MTPIPEQVMNQSVHDFEPKEADALFTVSSGDYQRLLFRGQMLRDRESTHLEGFRNFLISNDLKLPYGYDDENLDCLRFLQCLKWDYSKTYDEIVSHSEW